MLLFGLRCDPSFNVPFQFVQRDRSLFEDGFVKGSHIELLAVRFFRTSAQLFDL